MLRYAGGKTRAIRVLDQYVPDNTSEVVSPFLGGGSFELHLARKGVQVYASDVYEPLVDFWNTMKHDRSELISRLRSKHPFTKETYYECREGLKEENTPLHHAVQFFIVNRCCFSGCMTGGYTPSRSPVGCIDKLKQVDLTNLHVCLSDYEAQLARYPETFAYLDPPYDVPNLYLSQQFHHERLAQVLRARHSDWILCYNDTPRIRALYEDFCEIVPLTWSYGMNATRRSNEILIRPFRTDDPSVENESPEAHNTRPHHGRRAVDRQH